MAKVDEGYKLILFLLLGIASQNIFAREILPNQFVETKWSVEDELPQSTITSLVQTNNGYIWIATFGGLARFDGVRFKIFTTSVIPELKNNRIVRLLAAADGSLWIGAEDGEIGYLLNNKFSLIDDGKLADYQEIKEIFEDQNHKIWIGSLSGLSSCVANICQRESFRERVDQIRFDSAGNLWIRSGNNFITFPNGDLTQKKVLLDDIQSFELSPEGIFLIIRGNEFGIFSNDGYQTLLRFNSDCCSSIAVDSQGNSWISRDQILYKIHKGAVTAYDFPTSSNYLIIDKEDNFWTIGSVNGLSRFSRKKIDTWFGGTSQGINQTYSIVEDHQGMIWVSTDQGLLKWKNGITKTDSRLPNLKEARQGALAIRRDSTVWFIRRDGLFRFIDEKPEFITSIDLKTGVRGGFTLFEDSLSNLWYSFPGGGVCRYDRHKNKQNYHINQGLAGDTVNTIFEDKNGVMWFGTRKGLSSLQGEKFTNYTMADGLSNENIRAVYEDEDGVLWIGTYGGGLNRLKNGKIVSITTKHGLYDDIVSRILVDASDNFWMIGNRGIFAVSRRSLNDVADGLISQIYCNFYTSADGMKTSEGNGGFQNAGTKTSDGNLWFTTIDGVSVIDPSQKRTFLTNAIIEEATVGKTIYDFPEQLELPPNHEEIEINFTGIDFINPKQIRFRYRIKGLDDEWKEIGTRRNAYLSRLPFGSYTFQVSVINADGVWNEQTDDLQINVLPYFYQTLWARSAASILVIFTLVLLFIGIDRRYKKQKHLREKFSQRLIQAQERERLNLSSEIHDGLGHHLLIVKNWTDLSLKEVEPESKLKSYLQQIMQTSTTALEEIRLLARELSPYHIGTAGLSKTIRFLAKRVSNSSGIEFKIDVDNIDNLISPDDEINLFRVVQEALNNIIKHSQATEAKVLLMFVDDKIELTIADNGVGFPRTWQIYHFDGIGLNGITERARMLNAKWRIKSSPNKGTEIFLQFKPRKRQENQ